MENGNITKSHVGERQLADVLLSPRSVALIGASDDPSKTAARPLKFIRQAGFEGDVYPINPRRDTVLGEKAWSSLEALPVVPEHAFILTPTDAAIDALEECAERGVSVATILAAGFSESGAEGGAREARVREIVRKTGIRVLGPSGLGIVNVKRKLTLTANAAFAEPNLPAGGLFVASHSGSMIGALVSRGKARGIGFAGLVSVGNEVDLSIGEICAATLDDPEITGYMLFLETLRHADKLRDFAARAAVKGKSVVAYKLGRSSAAAELAVSHTGALAGEDDVAEAFLKDCGIARVETLEAFIESSALLKKIPVERIRHTKKPRVAVVTTTGGGAAMVVDQLGVREIDVQHPSEDTYARLSEAGVSVGHGRIVDLTLAGTRYDVMSAALKVLRSAPEFDLVVAVAGSSARFSPELAVGPILDSALESSELAPLVSFVVPDAPEALIRLSAGEVPCFRTPEACADAIAATFARRPPSPIPRLPVSSEGAGSPRLLDELEAYQLLARVGVSHAPAAALNAAAGAVLPDGLAYPVAVKVLSADVPHKTDAGGVELGIRDDEQLSNAIEKIRTSVERNVGAGGVERVLVQEMTKGLGEALVGFRRDPQVGPIVMLASGGIFTEIYRDRALRLAPVTHETALEMISEVKAMRALDGYRGRTRADLDALAAAIVSVSNLAILSDVNVQEAEVNPIMVFEKGRGVVAVDALVKIGS
ncbi:acetate--CoA ligase family protein [Paraburkholderia caribensis]|uniref:acetate--CoA ligase family protein n=1 Tax=Paraburkholderia caribensis TaxID=75105 RepID=UPI000720F7F9|nr:acetate--CoA ligase family protein [Paraburkholderia caribensis]ALP68570.1 6-carboxyhexanoate--CoA ligase [Paraburkholderia caribensis]AUT57928.1 CoA-binding protein [Paraburkholderia caribensis]